MERYMSQSIDVRRKKSTDVMNKYKDCILIVSDKMKNSGLSNNNNSRNVVFTVLHKDSKLQSFITTMRKVYDVKDDQTIFVHYIDHANKHNNGILKAGDHISTIYDKYKNEEDYVLYLYVSGFLSLG